MFNSSEEQTKHNSRTTKLLFVFCCCWRTNFFEYAARSCITCRWTFQNRVCPRSSIAFFSCSRRQTNTANEFDSFGPMMVSIEIRRTKIPYCRCLVSLLLLLFLLHTYIRCTRRKKRRKETIIIHVLLWRGTRKFHRKKLFPKFDWCAADGPLFFSIALWAPGTLFFCLRDVFRYGRAAYSTGEERLRAQLNCVLRCLGI